MIYDAETLSFTKKFDIPEEIKEGWGLALKEKNGKEKLYLSDGSAKIFVLNPETMNIEQIIKVLL